MPSSSNAAYRVATILRAPRLRLWAPLVIVLAATLAMAAELATGLTVTDNFRFNLTWPEQFVEQFRSGHLYPRWLPRSWSGMGSPVFYFYPPVFFWVTSAVDTLTAGSLGPERLVPLASLILLIASGLTMRLWLRAHCAEPQATLGAVAYMLAPFHLYHIYGTGALAEASSYASVPLVMLALARLAEGRTRYLPILALAYATLLLSHLPTALLVTLFLVGPYGTLVACKSARPGRFIANALAGGIIGAGISALFVLPALALLPDVSPAALSGPFYRPENWFFWHVRAGSMSGRMLFIIPVGIAAFLFSGAVAIELRSFRRVELFWAALTIALVALLAGMVPFVWRLPGLALVQFPWRALSLVEFTTITLLALYAPSIRRPVTVGAVATLAFAYMALGLMAAHTVGRTWTGQQQAAAVIRVHREAALEYLPAGTRFELGEGPDDVQVALPHLPLVKAAAPSAKITASEWQDGGMVVRVASPVATQVVLRRFYFPHWQLRDETGRQIQIVPDPQYRVVSFRASAGTSTFVLSPGTAPYELLGRAISLVSLILLAAIAAANASVLARRRDHQDAEGAGDCLGPLIPDRRWEVGRGKVGAARRRIESDRPGAPCGLDGNYDTRLG